MESKQKEKKSFMERVATFIVDKRNLFFLLFAAACIFCIFSRNWVDVQQDLEYYLGKNTETRVGLDIMDSQFVTYATADVMVSNVTYAEAARLADALRGIDGVYSLEFDDTDAHYKDASALFSVTFHGGETDEASTAALADIRSVLAPYDLYISTSVGNPTAAVIDQEMKLILGMAVIIIVSVLLFTSHTYAEIPVLLLTFGAAALLNMGTNYWFGEISFVSNSVAVVLQLGLAIDYAIILCHRFTEERELKDARSACISAVRKAVPEISGSSLTTLSGLLAMTFMQFRLGYDMGIVLMKAIVMSMLSVFLLMPGLLMLFSDWIDRSHHKSFVPKISFLGKFSYRTRYIVPPVFLLLLAAAFFCSSRCPYVFGYSTLDTVRQNEYKLAEKKIHATFGSKNYLALLIPAGDYDKEAAVIEALESLNGVDSCVGLANIDATGGYTLTSSLTPRQFAELADLDIDTSRLLYTAYAVEQGAYGQVVSDLDGYSVPLIDIFQFLYKEKEAGYFTLDPALDQRVDDLNTQLTDAEEQLHGTDWSRILVYLSIPEESQASYAFVETMRQTVKAFYPQAYFIGNTTLCYDLMASFSNDNLLITILSALFVIIVLFFTFKSGGLPVLLILVIEGSIWLNFSFPYLTGSNVFFVTYLIISSIQMGANIDYAIVISSRYLEYRKLYPPREAMVEALNRAFPTIVTSGTMLASAGIIIGQFSSENTISAIGTALGRGTVISIVLVLGVLPQILLLGDAIIQKTGFSLRVPGIARSVSGTIRLHGRVRGYVSGIIDADVRGVIQGTVNAVVDVGALETVPEELPPEGGAPTGKEADHEEAEK